MNRMADYYENQDHRMEKVVRDTEDGVYAKGQRVRLEREEAKQREIDGETVPLGGWMGAKDMGETKNDEEAGYGYGPLAVESRNSNVAVGMTEDDLESDAQVGEPGWEPSGEAPPADAFGYGASEAGTEPAPSEPETKGSASSQAKPRPGANEAATPNEEKPA